MNIQRKEEICLIYSTNISSSRFRSLLHNWATSTSCHSSGESLQVNIFLIGNWAKYSSFCTHFWLSWLTIYWRTKQGCCSNKVLFFSQYQYLHLQEKEIHHFLFDNCIEDFNFIINIISHPLFTYLQFPYFEEEKKNAAVIYLVFIYPDETFVFIWIFFQYSPCKME